MTIITSNSIIISHSEIHNHKFKPRIRLAVLASGFGSNFEAIVKSTKTGYLQADVIILIVNNTDCNAINKAIKLNIPYKIIDHKLFSTRESYDKEIINILKRDNIEIVVMAGWMRLVTKVLVEEYRNRIINIHPSLLPAFKGIKSIEKSLSSGVYITGCTVHIVDEEMDSGKILVQAALEIRDKETVDSLTTRIHKIEHEILPTGIIIAGNNARGLMGKKG